MSKEEKYTINKIVKDCVFPQGLYEFKDKETKFCLILEDKADVEKLKDYLIDKDQQITELKAELEQYKKNENACCGTIAEMIKHCDECELCECIGCEQNNSVIEEIKELKAENEKLKQQLKDQRYQICEKIRQKLMKYAIQKPNKDYSVITIVDNRLDFLIYQIEKGE